MLNMIDVGNRIGFLRKQNNLTQEELAEKLGITAQAISKWENGHTLPDTILLPVLAEFFSCSIDSILIPFAKRDSDFQSFLSVVDSKQGEFATQLYQKFKNEFSFTVKYDDKFYIFENEYNGSSAIFNIADKEDFIIRLDVETKPSTEKNLYVRIPLRHCSNYMHLIDKMSEHIKHCFRYSDCKSCTCNCPYVMVYNFEGVDYKQCHFIGVHLNSFETMEHIWTLIIAEHEKFMSNK